MLFYLFWRRRFSKLKHPLDQYGPFAAILFPKEPDSSGPLALLHLTDPDATYMVRQIRGAVNDHSVREYAPRLFESSNWRLHLVGAITALVWEDGGTLIPGLWKAIDEGSWVTPQLVATAVFLDKDFAANAQSRIDKGCPIRMPKRMNSMIRHYAMGPHGPHLRSAKMAASLLAMCKNSLLESWAESVKQETKVAQLLENDVDNSSAIASGWAERVENIIGRTSTT